MGNVKSSLAQRHECTQMLPIEKNTTSRSRILCLREVPLPVYMFQEIVTKLAGSRIITTNKQPGQSMEMHDRIIASWNTNANSWTDAVRMKAIGTRRLVTDQAVVDALLRYPGLHILDVGCGEGWLSKKLLMEGRAVIGFDVSAGLIEEARRTCNASFIELSYDAFATEPSRCGADFDLVVCNFSLLAEDVSTLLKAIKKVIKPSGHLIIQTVHPYALASGGYESGWREETFANLPGQWSPMPWYFRTIGSWVEALTTSGWSISRLIEPLHPETRMPASLILDAVPCGSGS